MDKLEKIYNDLNKEDSVEIHEDLITKFISKRAMLGIKNREISRLNRCRIYGMVRSMFLVFGNNLVKTRKLSKREDIFYLTLDELFNYEKYNLKELVKNRKSDYKLFYELPNYSRLIFSKNEFDKHHKSINCIDKEITSDKLQGISSSSGICEGEALVIEDINEKYDVKDKILITKMTDPGWVFLIASAKGIISEKGSLLSHTAIISRELNIPFIVGVDNATTCINSGDYVRMNANNGKIKVLKRSKKKK